MTMRTITLFMVTMLCGGTIASMGVEPQAVRTEEKPDYSLVLMKDSTGNVREQPMSNAAQVLWVEFRQMMGQMLAAMNEHRYNDTIFTQLQAQLPGCVVWSVRSAKKELGGTQAIDYQVFLFNLLMYMLRLTDVRLTDERPLLIALSYVEIPDCFSWYNNLGRTLLHEAVVCCGDNADKSVLPVMTKLYNLIDKDRGNDLFEQVLSARTHGDQPRTVLEIASRSSTALRSILASADALVTAIHEHKAWVAGQPPVHSRPLVVRPKSSYPALDRPRRVGK